MAGSRGKKDAAYSALQRLMEEPGSYSVILQDLLHSFEPDAKIKIARIMAGAPTFDDRGVAVVFGALLESSLETAIATHFVVDAAESRRLFSYTDDGPLAQFSAKVAMGYALGIYDNRMHNDLKWIARIRNAFAHARVEVSFGTEAIIAACDRLLFPRKDSPIHTSKGAVTTARQRFTACVGLSASYLGGMEVSPRRWAGSRVYSTMYDDLPIPSPDTPI